MTSVVGARVLDVGVAELALEGTPDELEDMAFPEDEDSREFELLATTRPAAKPAATAANRTNRRKARRMALVRVNRMPHRLFRARRDGGFESLRFEDVCLSVVICVKIFSSCTGIGPDAAVP